MKLETILANLSLHCGVKDHFGASHFPVYQTATFDLKKQDGPEFYDYSRSENPTRKAIENVFTQAEGGARCICTNTGVAALSLLFETTLGAGDTVLVERDCYGGTYRLLNVLNQKYGIITVYTDFTDIESLDVECKRHQPKLLLCESPTNPGLKIIDLAAVANIARKYSAQFAVDNSLATFASQRPLDFGADFSVFSTTKYVSGHGSIIGGAIVAKDVTSGKKMRYIANAEGKAQSPFDVFLMSLGLPTLIYRMKAQEKASLLLAQYLRSRSDVVSIKYTGFENHPDAVLIKKQMSIIPGIITLDFCSEEKAMQIVKNTKLFGEKASFGTSDSRVEIPSLMSHATYSAEDLMAIGLSKATVRISVGLEDIDDLINDIENALK